MTKWLEGYFIISTFDKDISCQSWDSNLRTPCMCSWGGYLFEINDRIDEDRFSQTDTLPSRTY